MLKPLSGSIEFAGQDISGLRPDEIVRRGLSHVLEGRHVFAKLTVQENLEIGAILRPRRNVVKDMEAVYSVFPDLAEKRWVRGAALSGGQQQQLVIARGLMAKPRLLLLDEPSLGLSPKMVNVMRQLLFQVVDEFRTAIFLVEQSVDMALSLSSRVYVLDCGHIVHEGSVAAIDAGMLEATYLGLEESRGKV